MGLSDAGEARGGLKIYRYGACYFFGRLCVYAQTLKILYAGVHCAQLWRVRETGW